MSKRPNLEELDYLFEAGEDFQITSIEYEDKTGIPLPKGKSYLQKNSALARLAKERGYIIADVLEESVPRRIVLFKRRGS